MVVFHHATNYVPTYTWSGIGATGVDIFFVISGFIMAYTCSKEPRAGEPRGELAAADFLLRRCVRVVPLYWLALAVSWRTELLHGALNVDLVRDFLFIPRFYFPGAVRIWPKLIPGWTINCEMFFYLVFGLAILASRHRLKVTLAVLIGLSIAGVIFHPAGAPGQLYTWSIFLEFALGILLYLAFRRWPVRLSMLLRLVLFSVALAALAFASRNNAYEYSSFRFLLYGIPAFIIVWLGLQVRQSNERPLLKLMGDASYSIYLFHATVGMRLAVHVVDMFPMPASRWLAAGVVLAIFMSISVVIGVGVHLIFEKPVLGHLRHWSESLLLRRHA